MDESKLESGYQKLSDEETSPKAEEPKTCKHLLMAAAALFALSSPVVGAPVMLQLFSASGVGSHVCDDGQKTCTQQVLMMANVFTSSEFGGVLFSLPAGVLFDKVGGRNLSCVASFVVGVCWAICALVLYGIPLGLDEFTFPFFYFTIAISFMAYIAILTGAASLIYFFYEKMGLVIVLMGTAMTLARFQSLISASLVLGPNALLSMASIAWIHVVMCGGSVLALLYVLPSDEEYRKQAEKVTGVTFKKETAGVFQIIAKGMQIIWANMSQHVFTLVMLAIGTSWAGSFLALSSQYAVILMGDPTNPADPVNATVMAKQGVITIGASFIVAIGIMPFVAILDELTTGRFVPISMACATAAAALLILVPSWPAQVIVCVAGSYTPAVMGVLINNRAFAFAAANRVGTVRGLLEFSGAALSLPMVLGTQTFLALLKDPIDMFGPVFLHVCAAGFIALTLFGIHFVIFGLPAAPIVLPEDERDMCLCYGCQSATEVLHVLELQDMKLLRSLWGSSDPDVQMNLVLHINSDLMAAKMQERSVEELVNCMTSEVAWRRKDPAAGAGIVGVPLTMGLGAVGANLSKLVDTSKFGRGQAKSMDQFEKEIKGGRSKFVVDDKDPTKVRRLVSLVVLRLFTNRGPNKKLLIQMSEQFPDGRERMKPQFPGTKKGPNSTLKSCITSILDKYNMAEMKINILEEERTEIEEEYESPSYPGVVTVYSKEIVDAYVVEDQQDALDRVGLPQGSSWSAFNDKSEYTYLLEWLTEDEAAAQNITISQPKKNTENEADSVPFAPTLSQGEATSPAKLLRPHEIVRSLEAREYSKNLVFKLHMEDVDGLEYWLMNEEPSHIVEAFVDLQIWSHADPDAMMNKFNELLPNERLATLLQKRHELKLLAIHFLKKELINVQNKNQGKKTNLNIEAIRRSSKQDRRSSSKEV